MTSVFEHIEKVTLVDDDVYRNIVSLRVSEDLFDDLIEDGNSDAHNILVNFEMEYKSERCPATINDRSFYYSTAVEYPFNTDNFMSTRYSDATFPAWYGAFQMETTIYETLHWMIKEGFAIQKDWISDDRIMTRERAVYLVHVDCMAYDLTELQTQIPSLLHSDDYSMTQMIGKRLHQEGARTITYPSARSPENNSNIVVFDIKALSHPNLRHYLTYIVNFNTRVAKIYREENVALFQYKF